MGLCASGMGTEQRAALQRSREIDRRNLEHRVREEERIKLLLLGAGESGKSTIFKQMKILYGKGYSAAERRDMARAVHGNTIQAMRALVEACDALGIKPEQPDAAARFVAATEMHDRALDAPLGALMAQLWRDPGIQRAYEQRARFQLIDSAHYYFSELPRLAAPGYEPTVEDILRSRIRTSGVVMDEYCVDGVDFVLYDVGGQRNERRKWIHCFDEVTAVIFVVALSEYDQGLFEDQSVNRMMEALHVFEEIARSPWFRDTSMILFLNKRDLFQQKIKTTDMCCKGSVSADGHALPPVFTDYTHGVCTCKAAPPDLNCECGVQALAANYILNQFLKRSLQPKTVFSHITCATDTENVRVVFNACKEIIFRQNMEQSGLRM